MAGTLGNQGDCLTSCCDRAHPHATRLRCQAGAGTPKDHIGDWDLRCCTCVTIKVEMFHCPRLTYVWQLSDAACMPVAEALNDMLESNRHCPGLHSNLQRQLLSSFQARCKPQ